MHQIDDAQADRDACGVGFVADVRGRQSREWLDHALHALTRLTHRGATGDGIGSADGAGVLTAIPWRALQPSLPAPFHDGDTPRAVGMCFLPGDVDVEAMRLCITGALAIEGWSESFWRQVPIDTTCLGTAERASCPSIEQVFVRRHFTACRTDDMMGLSLHRARRRAEAELSRHGHADAAIVSLSLDTIVYKSLVSPCDLAWFYADLADPAYYTTFALFHQRFSTNTLPSWPMAQPFHVLAHNGEINTVLGNRIRALRRHGEERSGLSNADVMAPAVPLTGSDSRSLDGAIDEMRAAGFPLPHAFARLTPRAWEHDHRLSARERAFERYQAVLADPWEGPAAIAFADGRFVGMTLDRNGFRPARVITTRGGLVCAGSEAGIFDIPSAQMSRVTRLAPGEMLVADLENRRLLDNRRCRRAMASSRPYCGWASLAIAQLPKSRAHDSTQFEDAKRAAPENQRGLSSPQLQISRSRVSDLVRLQRIFGYTSEELEVIMKPMAQEAKEPLGSMGDDTPLAAFTARRRILSDHFRQRFAQVTNPPIDPLREPHVLSLTTVVGRRGQYLREDALDARVVELPTPIVTCSDLRALCGLRQRPSRTLPIVFNASEGTAGFERAVDSLAGAACDAVKKGAVVLVLSDRNSDPSHVPLPPLLATAAVYQALGREGLGRQAGIVVDTGEARDAHQIATLLAFGANAVCPWLAFETAGQIGSKAAYKRALEQGLLKIFTKIGVCTAAAYIGSQLFEIVGLHASVVARFFPYTSYVEGRLHLAAIAEDACRWHAQATTVGPALLTNPGFHSFRRDGDHHIFNPTTVRAFHQVAGVNADEAYRQFREIVHARPATTARDLLRFRPVTPISGDEVESAESICRRFFASAMSVGALGPEAHRALAIAMNRLGARSNSGEGGEDTERFVRTTPDWANSTTKQVASARFGVTPGYLASARELQIKIAQGSKPGEGGQLPAEKVVGHIAQLRYAQPHTSLISPPPHHDIYSIEDLAQLIYDLRSFHPAARINVKLVSTTGIGVIAAGVVKAGTDAIQISGHAGGTGASPRGSIKHAGMPWELGLAEVHRLLTARGTRHRVVLQTDGGLVTGHDVAMAAALGADEFGFGTAALVALGCVMARQCHLNTCPVGIATQRPELRRRFAGSADQVVTYLRMVAEDVRRTLASLGLRRVQELVGRADLLEARDPDSCAIDVSALLKPVVAGPRLAAQDDCHQAPAGALTLNGRVLARAGTLLGRQAVTLSAKVQNTDRTVGATLAGYITRRFGAAGVARAPVHLQLTGTAGQSLGAFGVHGLDITLTGAANDGVGKGLHGGTIVIRPDPDMPPDAVLIGNAALYGATGGRLFVAGAAGERFAVRNSGAVAVVEGVGYHGCEYMTGGTVVILGDVGPNFAAGMTGGVAYVLDEADAFRHRTNTDVVAVAQLHDEHHSELRALIETHVRHTGSARASAVLARWPALVRSFRRVKPHEQTKNPGLAVTAGTVSHRRAVAATTTERPRT